MTATFIRQDTEFLADQWRTAKAEEKAATERRRQIEDQLSEALAINQQQEGTKSHDAGALVVKVTNRLTRKIDADLVQQIAAENALEPYLSTLFRWTPELDMRAWKACDESVRSVLSQAITTTPGRPSYAITTKE